MAETATSAPITNLSLRADRSRPNWLARAEAEGVALLRGSHRPALASRIGAGSAEQRLDTLQSLFRLELCGKEVPLLSRPPVQAGGADRTNLCAERLPLEKPELLWRRAIPGAHTAAPVGYGQTVFFADSNSVTTEVLADSPDGWGSHRMDGCAAMHLAVSDSLMVFSSVSDLYVRRRSDDDLLWCERHDSGARDGNPAIFGSMVVFAGQMGGLRACDLVSGRQLWFGLAGSTVGAPALHEDGWGVACDLVRKQVVAFGLDSGAELWRASLEGNKPIGPPMVTEGGITVVQTEDGGLYGFDRVGLLAWHHGPAVFNSLRTPRSHRSLAAAAGVVVVGGQLGGLTGLDETGGHPLWRAIIGVAFESDPIVDGERLLAVDVSGNFFCYDLRRGSLIWLGVLGLDPRHVDPARSKPEVRATRFAPLLHQGRLYLTEDSGQTTCLQCR